MARISKLNVTNEYYVARNGVTQCTAELNVYKNEGERLVRLQTFGSNSRQDKGKQSQVLHIDKEIAEELIKALQSAFDIIK
ncbi:hypothetical protein [Mariniplasma anaerobium]|uniref:Methionyl-tRNA formyltransferase n=1 Tax=Mariniplasma anaerobium TaxID=2735436 RepID=A0A7U9XV25_9MOLU|nr:hypothetical protein [Mariniplasma anaerobium]BCR35708.1 hypothetical protein MPAN_006010 [Mariniplasma anaerobium]